MRKFCFITMVFACTVFMNSAQADCPDPLRPTKEEEGIVTRLNYHSEGSAICLKSPSQSVEYLAKPGAYRCSKSKWVVDLYNNECVKEISSQSSVAHHSQQPVTSVFSNQNNQAPGVSGNINPKPQRNTPSGGASKTTPIQGACILTGTC
jgi:hypothetical protein